MKFSFRDVSTQTDVFIFADEEDFTEVRVAVVGNVDAGKSTLLGVLTHDTLGITYFHHCEPKNI